MYEVFLSLLAERGLTVAEFSRQSGIRQSTLSNWKNRGNTISADIGRKIAAFFGVSFDYLMTGQNPDNVQTVPPVYTNPETYILVELAEKADRDQVQMTADFLRRLLAYSEGLKDVLTKDKDGES